MTTLFIQFINSISYNYSFSIIFNIIIYSIYRFSIFNKNIDAIYTLIKIF